MMIVMTSMMVLNVMLFAHSLFLVVHDDICVLMHNWQHIQWECCLFILLTVHATQRLGFD